MPPHLHTYGTPDSALLARSLAERRILAGETVTEATTKPVQRRSGFRRLLSACKPGDVVLVPKLSDFGTPRDAIAAKRALDGKGVELLVGEPACWATLASAASMGKAVQSRRAVAREAVRREKGIHTGTKGPRPGFKRSRRHGRTVDTLDFDTLADLAEVLPRLQRGELSLRGAAAILEEKTCQRAGRPFRNSTLHDWTWWPSRVKVGCSLFLALHAAGTNTEEIARVERLTGRQLIAEFPIPRASACAS